MKRIVSSTGYAELHPCFSQLETQAFNAGYQVRGSGTDIIQLVPVEDVKYMPFVDVTTVKKGNDEWYRLYYNCTVKFPLLRASEMDYYDSVAYYIDKWQAVGKLVSWLQGFIFEPEKWEDDQE